MVTPELKLILKSLFQGGFRIANFTHVPDYASFFRQRFPAMGYAANQSDVKHYCGRGEILFFTMQYGWETQSTLVWTPRSLELYLYLDAKHMTPQRYESASTVQVQVNTALDNC